MRRLALLALALFPTLLAAQREPSDLRNRGEWVTYTDAACIGGGRCPEKRLRIQLQDKPVVAIRFRAHDDIGEQAGGVLRVKIDTNTIRPYMDIARKGELYTVDVDELTGQYLIFEPVAKDEVDIQDVAVLYSRDVRRRDDDYRDRLDRDRDRGRDRGGWRRYSEQGCIGGSECKKNGTRITVALEDAPVLGIRFYAHDSVGTRADGKLTVRIDDTSVASYVDVARDGKRHELDVDNLRGSRLTISTANDDEVEIRDIEVLYGARRSSSSGNYRGDRELRHEGACIGGDECGGRRARIRIPLRDRAVASIRLYARDDIGTRAGGELRIRIDDQILEYALDIPRDGRTFTIDGEGKSGEFLFIEPAEDDEVQVKDIRITFED
ncbi:MAG TPA: hypothetical protein VGF48_00965 [Thermoanaerobaculia bacterium]|jgi:hypothetical protein